MDDIEPIDTFTADFLCPEKDEAIYNTLLEVAAAYRSGHLFYKHAPIAHSCPYVVQENGKIYFEAAYKLDEERKQVEEKITSAQAHLEIDIHALSLRIDALVAQDTLSVEQAHAIREAAQTSLSCISGGPGTGKTYTAGWLVTLFLEQHPDARIGLCAPTGKAAANLLESIKRVSPSSALEAKTLHSLLGIKRIEHKKRQQQLTYDLLLVDESSMIDMRMYVKLLSSLADGARIVFLGDPFQLPPIEPGEPFTDLVAKRASGALTVCKRQENREIIDLADAVKRGSFEEAIELLQDCWQDEQQFSLEAYVKPFYTLQKAAPDACFKAFLERRLLCPVRHGPFGTLAVNERIKPLVHLPFEPILITKNDYTLGLTNGQVGIIAGSYAYFEEAKGLRKIPHVLLPSYETAYCLSVHKSQGSEFGEVTLLLPEGSERFGRRMLYTAITRAKKKIAIYSSFKTIKSCILDLDTL